MLMTKSIWFHTPLLDEGASPLAKSVLDSLKNTGMQLQVSPHPEQTQGAGIILLEEVSDLSYPLVALASDSGNRRLLLLLAEDSHPNGERIWHLFQAGASDVLIWQEDLLLSEQIKARFQRWREIDQTLASPLVRNNLIGQSRKWKLALQQVVEAASYTQESVLLAGATGTGKELAARLIHTLDPQRKKHNLVIVDCTNINRELSGSELFGHERGAFTGAVTAREGAFATADGGSLFLDEVGELPPELQVQLLRVLQEHTYRRVGSNVWHKTDFRLICATNRNLKQDMQAGKFRSDLYYRIANWMIELPLLKDRGDDILLLAHHFLEEASNESPPPEMNEQVKQYLLARTYQGNVRELRNLIYRIYSRNPGTGIIMMGDIPHDEWLSCQIGAFPMLKDSMQETVKVALNHYSDIGWKILRHMFKDIVFQTALNCAGDSPKEAANLLKVDVRSVQKWRKNLDTLAEIDEIDAKIPTYETK